MKNIVFFSCSVQISSKNNLLYYFWISMKSLLLTSIYCYHLKVFFSNNYNLANSQLHNNLLGQLQFFECYRMFKNHFLQADRKMFVHQSYHCSLSFLHLEENIDCNLFGMFCFEMIKQKLYLLPKKLDQLNNLSISFVVVLLLLIGIYSV